MRANWIENHACFSVDAVVECGEVPTSPASEACAKGNHDMARRVLDEGFSEPCANITIEFEERHGLNTALCWQ